MTVKSTRCTFELCVVHIKVGLTSGMIEGELEITMVKLQFVNQLWIDTITDSWIVPCFSVQFSYVSRSKWDRNVFLHLRTLYFL